MVIPTLSCILHFVLSRWLMGRKVIRAMTHSFSTKANLKVNVTPPPQTLKASSKGLRALSLKAVQQNIPGLPKVPGQWGVIKTFFSVFVIKG